MLGESPTSVANTAKTETNQNSKTYQKWFSDLYTACFFENKCDVKGNSCPTFSKNLKQHFCKHPKLTVVMTSHNKNKDIIFFNLQDVAEKHVSLRK